MLSEKEWEEIRVRKLAPEAGRSHSHRIDSGFYLRWMGEEPGLDVGYRGDQPDRKEMVPVLPSATGIELDYRGYDGIHLPQETGSQGYVFASHILEHIKASEVTEILHEWMRVLRTGGYLVLIVPHRDLYEKKMTPPSSWNPDHVQFFTCYDVCQVLESAFNPNSFRIRHMLENDRGFNYTLGPEVHSSGCYEIECVIEKIKEPQWRIL
jgi:SAM-dependent methyltransferase